MSQALKQVHVLLVFHQGPVERRNGLRGVSVGENFLRDIVSHEQLEPVDQLEVLGFFFMPGTLRTSKKISSASFTSPA